MGIKSLYTLEVKSSEDSVIGSFVGDLSVYGNIDDVGDIVERGAFKTSLSEKTRYPLLWQHGQGTPIGFFDVISDDDNALVIKGQLLTDDVQQAKEAHALLKAGVVTGLSIGYNVRKGGAYFDNDGIRHLTDIELMEGSLVTFPANRLAQAQAKQRFNAMAKKSRFAGCGFLEKMTDEEREEALRELEALEEEESAKDKPEEETEEEEEKTEEEEESEEEEELVKSIGALRLELKSFYKNTETA